VLGAVAAGGEQEIAARFVLVPDRSLERRAVCGRDGENADADVGDEPLSLVTGHVECCHETVIAALTASTTTTITRHEDQPAALSGAMW
jgi:hypothetical protein